MSSRVSSSNLGAFRTRLASRWRGLSLSVQFMAASLVILVAAMLGVGIWVGQQIAEGVVHRTAATTALYVESFISPQIQELAGGGELSREHVDALGRLLGDTPLGREIVAFKVWGPGGHVLFSTDASMTGKSFPVQPNLRQAWLGGVASKVSDLEDAENVDERARFSHLLETYTPVRETGTNRVIAVAEFYQIADDLDREVAAAQGRSWLAVALATLATYLLLAGIVRRGSNTIGRQKVELQSQVQTLKTLLGQNEELHDRVRRAATRTTELNESFLRRVSSELHDGPAQDLGLSLMRLDALRRQIDSCPEPCALRQDDRHREELDTIQFSLNRAMQDVRAIATGLRLPEIENLTLPETVARAVRSHERRTSSRVALEMDGAPAHISVPVKITVYRLVQEALSNAYRHGEGAEQRVAVSSDGEWLQVAVADQGPGFEWKGIPAGGQHLGLTSMRERVESLGGDFRVETARGMGTKVVARVPVQGVDGLDAAA